MVGRAAAAAAGRSELRHHAPLDPEHRVRHASDRGYASCRKFARTTSPASLSLSPSRRWSERDEGKHGALGTPGYKIREGSVEHTTIGGMPALRAVGEFERNGMKVTELLTWIFTRDTRGHNSPSASGVRECFRLCSRCLETNRQLQSAASVSIP